MQIPSSAYRQILPQTAGFVDTLPVSRPVRHSVRPMEYEQTSPDHAMHTRRMRLIRPQVTTPRVPYLPGSDTARNFDKDGIAAQYYAGHSVPRRMSFSTIGMTQYGGVSRDWRQDVVQSSHMPDMIGSDMNIHEVLSPLDQLHVPVNGDDMVSPLTGFDSASPTWSTLDQTKRDTADQIRQSSSLTFPELDRSSNSEGTDGRFRAHPYYHVKPHPDGFYYCPYTRSADCSHQPTKLKCNYECVRNK